MRDHDIWLTDWREQRSMQIQVASNVKIERFLQGSEQLEFELKLDDPKLEFIHEDQTIEAYGDKWVVDHFEDKHATKGYRKVVCNAYWIRLSWRTKVGTTSVLGKTPEEGVDQLLAQTGWTQVGPPTNTDLYTLEEIDGTVLSLLRRWSVITGYEIVFDNVNKTVRFISEVGQQRQLGFRWAYNIKEISRTYYPPQATRLYPIGANDLTIANANPNGLPYIEDYSFYLAQGLSITEARALYRKDLTWVDQRYLLELNLYDAAVIRLSKLAQPRIYYRAKVLDLSRILGEDADPLITGYEPGDYATVDDEELGVLEDVRITRTVSFPAEPKRDEVELGFLTNGLLDVSDGGNREIQYDAIAMIVDTNNDPVTIGISEKTYNEIALTSAGAATIVTGSTFVGTASGAGTVTFKMTLDGVTIGQEYTHDFVDGELVEFSWPSFASDLSEGAHEVQWRAVTTSGDILLATGAGRSWILTRGAVGVGQASTPNQFITDSIEEADLISWMPVPVDSDYDITFFDVAITDQEQIEDLVQEEITSGDFLQSSDLSDQFILPFTLESTAFGSLDGPGVLSSPEDPPDDNYSPPFGGSSGGSNNYGPFGDEVIGGNWIPEDDFTSADATTVYVQDAGLNWWKVLTFTASGTLDLAAAGSFEYLAVGAGAASGPGTPAVNYGAPGAGGTVRTGSIATGNATETITVGTGGAAGLGSGTGGPTEPGDGGDTSIGGHVTAGGGTAVPNADRDGGGNDDYDNETIALPATLYEVGGGAGAGEDGGTDGEAYGGDGLTVALDWDQGTYGGGGGGVTTANDDGLGGDGGGADSTVTAGGNGLNGSPGTDGLGGGAGAGSGTDGGSNGGSGVVKVAVPAPGYTPPTGPESMDVDFTHIYRANGPEFLALGIADGGAVTAWPDELLGIDMTLTGSTLDANDTKLNNEPSIFINGNGDQNSAMAAAQGSIIVVAWHPAASQNRWHDNHTGGRWIMGIYSGTWQFYFGSSAGQSVSADTDAHLFTYVEDGSSDVMEVDGTVIYGPSDYGSQRVSQINIVDDGDGVHIAFLATHAGDPRGDADWADFEQWVEDTYGITIA